MTALQKAKARIRHLLTLLRKERRTLVEHGDDPNTPRPDTEGPVNWLGHAEPANARDGDHWDQP